MAAKSVSDDFADLDRRGADPHRDRPRKSDRREVAARLNRLALCLDRALEELSELRHELGVSERLDAIARRATTEEVR
jgi:hypothetical protein